MLSRQATERSFRRSSGADSIPRRQGKLAKARLGSRGAGGTAGVGRFRRLDGAAALRARIHREFAPMLLDASRDDAHRDREYLLRVPRHEDPFDTEIGRASWRERA